MKSTFPILLLLLVVSGSYAQDMCACQDCPTFIPDNAFITKSVHVYEIPGAHQPGEKLLCGVQLTFDHQYVSDLEIKLQAPSGETVTLVGPVGFFGQTDGNFWQVSFLRCDTTQTAVNPDPGFSPVWSNNQLWGLDQYYSGSYYPAAGCLEVFDTATVTGEWKLFVIDYQANDYGNLYDFSLVFCENTVNTCYLTDSTLTVSNKKVCINEPVVFEEKIADTTFTAFAWSFPGGTPSASDSAVAAVIYTDPGVYSVTLTAYSATDTATYIFENLITVKGIPESTITYEIVNGQLTASLVTSGQLLGFQWNGDPVTFPHPVDSLGQVNLVAISEHECGIDTTAVFLDISLFPKPYFEWSNDLLKVSFNNLTTNADSVAWDFGDGSIASDFQPVHDYPAEGLYPVVLQAWNAFGTAKWLGTVDLTNLSSTDPGQCGCQDCPTIIEDNGFITKSVYIYEIPGAHQSGEKLLCGVQLAFDHEYLSDLEIKLQAPSGETVTLVGPVGLFGHTDSTIWQVSFLRCDTPQTAVNPDPGFSAVWSNNQLWGEGQSYAGSYYPAAGCLEVFDTATVTGEWKLIAADNQSNDFGNLLHFSLVFCENTVNTCYLTDSTLSISDKIICANKSVQFEEMLRDSTYTSFAWSFPGGIPSSSDSAAVEVVYPDPGVYSVTLTAYSVIDTAVYIFDNLITVNQLPENAITYNILNGQLTASPVTSGQLLDFQLNGAAANFPQLIDTLGQANLVSISQSDCGVDTTTLFLDFSLFPKPYFEWTNDSLIVTFTNLTSNVDAIAWDFGDGTISSVVHPIHEFPAEGLYPVVLQAWNAFGTAKWLETVDLTDLSSTGNPDPSEAVLVFPNPGSGKFNIVSTNKNLNSGFRWKLINTAGREVVHGQGVWPSTVIRVENQPEGAYFLQIMDEQGVRVVKIMMQ